LERNIFPLHENRKGKVLARYIDLGRIKPKEEKKCPDRAKEKEKFLAQSKKTQKRR